MIELLQTPSQTVGPYFAYGLVPKQYGYNHTNIITGSLVDENSAGEHIQIIGQVLDGEGVAIPDAMIELWQPDIKAIGRFGTGTDEQNRFIFNTIKPQSFEGQAPHISVVVMMRGLLVHAFTRLYFSDETEANAQDEVLRSVPEERRATLIAQRGELGGKTVYTFDIHMQGDNETVFFDV
ncbi:MAG: protocatechuate 3,4-dioxygenase subunit alpha [Saprospiraceae bacterium]|nr:protocatechuate 3,4-dioxygenase subunit alpha [Saprospiraceae bacterium]